MWLMDKTPKMHSNWRWIWNHSYLLSCFSQLSHETLRRRDCNNRKRAIRLVDRWLFAHNSNNLTWALLLSRCRLSISLSECRNSVFSSMIWSMLRNEITSFWFIGFVWFRDDRLIIRDKLFNELQLLNLSRIEALDAYTSLKFVLIVFIVLELIKPPRNRVTLRDFRGDEKISLELWVRKNFGLLQADRLLFCAEILSSKLIVPKKLISFRIDEWWLRSLKLVHIRFSLAIFSFFFFLFIGTRSSFFFFFFLLSVNYVFKIRILMIKDLRPSTMNRFQNLFLLLLKEEKKNESLYSAWESFVDDFFVCVSRSRYFEQKHLHSISWELAVQPWTIDHHNIS